MIQPIKITPPPGMSMDDPLYMPIVEYGQKSEADIIHALSSYKHINPNDADGLKVREQARDYVLLKRREQG